jgi:Asp-tRNA(Asn)/Glu-tRNA(Gln) amidotransferase A subunit family amidase
MFDTFRLYAKSVDDLKLLFDAFQLVDDGPVEDLHIKGAKFAFLTFPTSEQPSPCPSIAGALTRGAEILRSRGADAEEITLGEEFRSLYKYHLQVLASDGRIAFLPECRVAKEQIHSLLTDHVENVDKHIRKHQLKAFDELFAMRPNMDATANRYAAIIAPSVIDEAPMGYADTGDAAFCESWTAMHMPVVNVPCFKGDNEVPTSLSIVTSRYRD